VATAGYEALIGEIGPKTGDAVIGIWYSNGFFALPAALLLAKMESVRYTS